jgi:hypothetical protein
VDRGWRRAASYDAALDSAAHPDDALVFRGDQFPADAHLPGARIVHVTGTAGDAGRTDGWWQDGAVRAPAAAQCRPARADPS